MASTIRIRVNGRPLVFTAPGVVHIGRDPAAEVVLTNVSASRQHAEVRWQDNAWYLVDLGSRNGVHVAGQSIRQLRLDAPVLVRFGRPDDGEDVFVEPFSESAARPAGPPEVGVLAQTVLPSTPGPGASGACPPLVVVLDDGPQRRFDHGVVRIGRRPDLEVVTSNPAVSREHARLEPGRRGWRYIDTSNGGSYHDGRPVSRLEITAPETLVLGDPLTGPSLRLAPQIPAKALERAHSRRRRGRRALTAIAAALVVCLVAGAVFVAVQRRETGLSTEALQQAKRATVSLSATSTDADGNPANWGGSGSIISPDGLILTNAHVAKPQAPGQGVLYGPVGEADPEYVTVSLTQAEDDKPAQPTYRAKVLIADGYLDAAVLKIYATADGAPLDQPLQLPTLPVGRSADLRTGDRIWVLGFPGISESEALTVTNGLVATFVPNEHIGPPRFEIDTNARIAPGNSGGAAIDEQGRLIGVPSAGVPDKSGALVESGRVYTIDLMKPLVDKARAGGDPNYVTPYVVAETGREQVTERGWSQKADADCAAAPGHQLPSGTSTAYALFAVRGLPSELDLSWTVYAGEPATPIGQKDFRWDRSEAPECLVVPLPFGQAMPDGPLVIVLRGGPLLKEYARSTAQIGAAAPAALQPEESQPATGSPQSDGLIPPRLGLALPMITPQHGGIR